MRRAFTALFLHVACSDPPSAQVIATDSISDSAPSTTFDTVSNADITDTSACPFIADTVPDNLPPAQCCCDAAGN